LGGRAKCIEFTNRQGKGLREIKDVFIVAMSEHGSIDVRTIFANPIYKQLFGSYQEVNGLSDGGLDQIVEAMQGNFQLPQPTGGGQHDLHKPTGSRRGYAAQVV
jgi:hypothetical protein